jgi:phi LC3 family holin
MEAQNRFKSWALWVSVIGAIWTVLQAFGLPEQWGITSETFNAVTTAIGTILIAFGIVNNPTDKKNL